MKSAAPRVAGSGTRTVVHGVDFSGADGGGAAKIRIAERELASRSAVAIRPRVDRNGLKRAILESAQDGRSHLWRIDAPFGLPVECFAEQRPEGFGDGPVTWMAIAEWMAGFQTAREWRSAMRELSRREPKRACDRALATPLAPMNLRVFKQTFTVITEILLPLAREGIAIEPVSMPANPESLRVRVVESCPASVLRHRGWPYKGYKGGGEPPRVVREEIVRLLRQEGLEIASQTAVEAIHDVEGDLLDALILTTEPIAPPAEGLPAEALVEAWVY
jgi:hypothetical protein